MIHAVQKLTLAYEAATYDPEFIATGTADSAGGIDFLAGITGQTLGDVNERRHP